MTDTIEEIRARHEAVERSQSYMNYIGVAHLRRDRATLLLAVDRLSAELAKERERRVEVEGAMINLNTAIDKMWNDTDGRVVSERHSLRITRATCCRRTEGDRPMTREELEKLLAAATPGPWFIARNANTVGDCTPEDAALIVAAVNALPELLERVRRLEEALKPFADEADKWANCIDKDAQEILIAHPIDVTVDSDGEIDGLNDAAFTLGDLRRARAALKETGQ